MIALLILLCNLQNSVYSFIDMDSNNNKIDVRLFLKMARMLYMVRAAIARGSLSYITC